MTTKTKKAAKVTTNAGHTPGPWVKGAVRINGQVTLVNGPDDGRTGIDPFSGRKVKCDPPLLARVSTGPSFAAGVGEANLRLILAAPELLAACIEAQAVIEEAWRMGATPKAEGLKARDRVRAAIAKAS